MRRFFSDKDLVYKWKLQGKENCYPKNLSGGQKQRIAISRSFNFTA